MFKKGRHENPPGHPPTANNEEKVKKMINIFYLNRRMRIRILAQECHVLKVPKKSECANHTSSQCSSSSSTRKALFTRNLCLLDKQ